MPPEDPSLEECEGQRGELRVRCGTIVCDVRELEAGAPPSQLTVFAYLFVRHVDCVLEYSGTSINDHKPRDFLLHKSLHAIC